MLGLLGASFEEEWRSSLNFSKLLGVPQSDAEALKWFRLAAAQGSTTAQSNLGTMYAEGQGVPKDYVEAHMWSSLADAGGNKDAAKNRSAVERKMTPEQIAKAKRRAAAWEPSR